MLASNGSCGTSAGGEGQILPHVLGNFHGESKTAHGAQANRVVNHVNVDVAHVGETALDEGTKALDGRAATGENHVLAELVMVFGVGTGDELLDVLNDRVNDGFASPLHAVGDVEGHRLAFNGKVDQHRFIRSRGGHEGELFLPASCHVLGDLSTVVLGLDFLDERVVDVVASVAGVHLVAWSGDGSVNTAKVRGTCTDVNDEGVGDHVESISHSERLGDDHGGVNGACSGVKDGGLVDVAGFGRSTDDGDHTVVFLGVGKPDEVGDEVSDILSVLGCVLDDTEFEGAEKVQRQSILEGLVAKEHVSLQEVASDGVFGRTNDRQFFHFVAV